MRLLQAPTPSRRQADNELYDRGCDLVEAASAIRRAAGAPEGVRAVPAVLGCIEAALHELLEASAAFEEASADSIGQRPRMRATPTIGAVSDRMRRGYANLRQALADAERAAAAARPLAGRALDAVGAARPDRARR